MAHEEPRLLVISNRLPVTLTRKEDGSYDCQMSSGGLVSGLKGLSKARPFHWFGWAGLEVPDDGKEAVRERLKKDFDASPVFLQDRLAELHYNGFSNSVVWPLFHYFPDKMSFDDSASKAYKEVNEPFCETVEPFTQDGDLIWVHDYHLMLFPGMLRQALRDREKKKKVRIGFFLHTPFPSNDFFSILPFHDDILRALLECDVIGFHIEQYVSHFIESCEELLGIKRSGDKIQHGSRTVLVKNFPLGIEPEEFQSRYDSEKVQDVLSELESRFAGQRIMLGGDRRGEG